MHSRRPGRTYSLTATHKARGGGADTGNAGGAIRVTYRHAPRVAVVDYHHIPFLGNNTSGGGCDHLSVAGPTSGKRTLRFYRSVIVDNQSTVKRGLRGRGLKGCGPGFDKRTGSEIITRCGGIDNARENKQRGVEVTVCLSLNTDAPLTVVAPNRAGSGGTSAGVQGLLEAVVTIESLALIQHSRVTSHL